MATANRQYQKTEQRIRAIGEFIVGCCSLQELPNGSENLRTKQKIELNLNYI
jgi:Tfp pilus assembly protein PilF